MSQTAESLRQKALDDLERGPLDLLIGDDLVPAAEGLRASLVDPSTEKPLADVACAGEEDIGRAVGVGSKAFEEGRWSDLSVAHRSQVLWRIGAAILDHADELSRLETISAGKPFARTSAIDVPQAAAHFFYQASILRGLSGETLPISVPDHLAFTERRPVGVIGAITPWNYPLLMAARCLAPALAAGNSVILKPAEETPVTTLRLGELIYECGLPAGTLSVVPGVGEVAGAALAAHPAIRRLSFVGGRDAAREIVYASAGNFKKLSLELGGKAAFVICADADIAQAAEAAVTGAFANSGQDCAAAARVYVHSDVYDDVLSELRRRTGSVRVGDPFADSTELGPLISGAHRDKVRRHVEGAVVAGAVRDTCSLGDSGQDGYFYPSTLLTGVAEQMAITHEEVFGPVLIPYRFDSVEEAVRLANDTEYGLVAGVWSRDIYQAHSIAKRLDAGTVWINTWDRFDPAAPFGGVKESGYGRDMGTEALHENTSLTTTWTKLAE